MAEVGTIVKSLKPVKATGKSGIASKNLQMPENQLGCLLKKMYHSI